MRVSSTLIALALSAAPALAAHGRSRRHDELAKRIPGDVAEKRSFDNARYTYFDDGL
jgi:hypothetical protein